MKRLRCVVLTYTCIAIDTTEYDRKQRREGSKNIADLYILSRSSSGQSESGSDGDRFDW